MKSIKKLVEFKDPLREEKLSLALIPIEKLEVIAHQRKPSTFHVERLKRSMELLGFTTPVLCFKKSKDKYIIVDGQHRYLAAKDLGAEYLPCVVVPQKFGYFLIELNAEKTLTIKEKSYVALQIYKRLLEEKPKLSEISEEVQDSIEGGVYLVTMGLAYEKTDKFVGSAFQTIVKRVDNPIDKPLESAYKIRSKRANMLIKANKILRDIARAITAELGQFPPFLYQTIISYANPIGRKRLIERPFEEVTQELIANLEQLKENPMVVLEREALVSGTEEEHSA
mgnify:CR=1 FL=1